MTATLNFNNTRDNKVYVRLGVNSTEVPKKSTAYECKKSSTTKILLDDVEYFQILTVRVQSGDGKSGSGKGDITVTSGSNATNGTYILGEGGNRSVEELSVNASLIALDENDNTLAASTAHIESTG